MTKIELIVYEDLLLSPISFEMTSSQEPLPLFPSECAYERLTPLLNAPKTPITRSQMTALLLRICFILESCSTISRLDIRDRVERTLKSYVSLQAPDASHTQDRYCSGTESIDLACILAGLVHHSGVRAVKPPLPRKAPGKAAVANLRSKLDAYVTWKGSKGASPVPRLTHPRPSSVAGSFTPLPKITVTHQRPHSAYCPSKTQHHSNATFSSPASIAFVRSPSPNRLPTRWTSCSSRLSTIKEPENDRPNGSSVLFPEWSPYQLLESKMTGVVLNETISRREKDPYTLSQVNSPTVNLPA
jgi:hypothetical protein